MNKQQIRWASEHDWFIKETNNGVLVRGEYEGDNNLEITSFDELYIYAGY